MAKKLIDLTKPENEDEIVERKNALQLARAAKALQKLGERLVSLTERELETIPLTESLRDAVLEAKRLDQKKALYR